jgi:redox-sensitive bicupin YhaK (pirin superfamily)
MRVPQRSAEPVELISYVHEGRLAHEDSFGRSGLIHGGEFQRMSVGQGARRIETNTSRADWSHVFQIELRATEQGVAPPDEQKRFSTAERRGSLCVVGSPDGRKGSLRLQLDAVLYSAILDPGQHVVHELSPGRSAWLHVVTGEASLGDDILSAGDGVGFTADRAVSLTAREVTEILLLNLQCPEAEASDREISDVPNPS